MRSFYLASGNLNKYKEMAAILSDGPLQIVLPSEKIAVEENGDTYYANAFLKAKAYFDLLKAPVLSDDSGLNVESIPDELGVHSARFGGEDLNDKQRWELLLQKMEGTRNRRASFTCVLCFYISPQEIFFFEGKLSGEIAVKASGSLGFGYDPIFIPHSQHLVSNLGDGEQSLPTLAQTVEWKKIHSHRTLALQSAVKFFTNSLPNSVCL